LCRELELLYSQEEGLHLETSIQLFRTHWNRFSMEPDIRERKTAHKMKIQKLAGQNTSSALTWRLAFSHLISIYVSRPKQL
jgi:hypothetical protein